VRTQPYNNELRTRFCNGTSPVAVWEKRLDARREVLAVLDEVLGLNGRTSSMTDDSPLMGAVPELDSMAVVGVLTALEERLGIEFDDDDLDGSTFATVGNLVRFVDAKVSTGQV
jgi:acyl carrier protein